MRLVVVLAVAAAATVMLGALLVAASVVMRHVTRRPPVPPDRLVRMGLYVVVAGVAFGLVVLVLFAIGRLATGRRGSTAQPRPRSAPAEHRRGTTARPQSPAPRRHDRPTGGDEVRPGQGPDRGRAGDATADSGHVGHRGPRSSRPPLLNPTNVYTPGGLIGAPRDGHAPGPPDGQPIPEILRTAGPGPGGPGPGTPGPGGPGPGSHGPRSSGPRAPGPPGPGGPGGGRGQDRPPPGWAGPPPPRPGYQPEPPRPGFQPGMNPGSPGRAPYSPGGAPVPPRDHVRPREGARPGHAMPHREGMPRPEPMPGAGVPPPGMPPRGAGPQRPQAPRPGGPGRPGSGHPPRDPAYPPPPGQGHGAGYGPGPGQGPGPGHGPGPGYGPGQGGPGRPAHGPGYAAPGGRRAAGPYQGSSEPTGEFEGGYAKVIRASDSPVRPAQRPGPSRAADSARAQDPARPPGEVPADVFVYRDTASQPGDTRREPGPNDPSYWYDLPGTGPAEEAPHVSEETRGPFEPLVSSAGPPRGSAAGPGAAGPGAAGPETADGRGAAGPDATFGAPGQDEQEDIAHAHARKLEQIKDLYLTAEAIGETNVDKHFDQLLAQQRELISEYFRQSPGTPAHGAADQAQAVPDGPGTAEPTAGGVPENARVAADPPRAW